MRGCSRARFPSPQPSPQGEGAEHLHSMSARIQPIEKQATAKRATAKLATAKRATAKQTASVIEVLDAKTKPKAKPKVVRYDYWLETHKPLACLAFVVPLLLWYEVGMVLHSDVIRSGIDRLIQMLFAPLGEARLAILPLFSIGVFLFLHHRREDTGAFRAQTLFWMAVESLVLATILFLACDALLLYFDNQHPRPLAGLATAFSDPHQYGRILTCIGAGIHEEILFRLLLFAPLLYGLGKVIRKQSIAVVVAATIVSLIFATAHCDIFNPEGFPFQLSTFLFRFSASVFLCVLFRFRGIAVAIGVHAVFDILAIS